VFLVSFSFFFKSLNPIKKSCNSVNMALMGRAIDQAPRRLLNISGLFFLRSSINSIESIISL